MPEEGKVKLPASGSLGEKGGSEQRKGLARGEGRVRRRWRQQVDPRAAVKEDGGRQAGGLFGRGG